MGRGNEGQRERGREQLFSHMGHSHEIIINREVEDGRTRSFIANFYCSRTQAELFNAFEAATNSQQQNDREGVREGTGRGRREEGSSEP